MTPAPRKKTSVTDRREPRRRARAFEAFMGEQALSLHRTVAAARRTVLGTHPARSRDTAPAPRPV